MIFVTVGTHEQPFNRLIQKVDELVRDGEIQEDVFMQVGFSTYEPRFTKWKKFLGYDEMIEYLQKADVVITHGGPSTYMQVLQMGKIPIVVPRQAQYGEHINNHQLDVTQKVLEKGYPLLLCENIGKLSEAIQESLNMADISQVSHNEEFVLNFKNILGEFIK